MQLKSILLATITMAAATAQTTPQVYALFECIEAPPLTAGTPLAGHATFDWTQFYGQFTGDDVSLDAPHVYYSYYNTGSNLDIGRGIPRNFVSPGSAQVDNQPTRFFSGYNRAVFSLPIALQTPWMVVNWFLNGVTQTLPVAFADAKGSSYCPVSLIPQYPLVAHGIPTRVKIATLASPLAGPLTVELGGSFRTLFGFNQNNWPPADKSYGTVSNATYEGGSIYADVRGGLTSSGVNLIRLRVLSGTTVVAFGHVPVMVAEPCPVTPSGSLPSATLGASYSASIGATTGYVYTLSGDLPPGLALSGNTLSGTPVAAGTYPISITLRADDRSCYSQANFNLTVNGPSCAADVTSQVSYSFSGLTRNLATGLWSQTVTLQNRGATALPGPVTLVLTGLSPNATLTNVQGLTSCAAPSGQPFVQNGSTIGANQAISFPLTFTNSQANQSITYTVRVLAGGTQQ